MQQYSHVFIETQEKITTEKFCYYRSVPTAVCSTVAKVNIIKLKKEKHITKTNQQQDFPFTAEWTHLLSKTTRIKTQNALRKAEGLACAGWNKPTCISSWQCCAYSQTTGSSNCVQAPRVRCYLLQNPVKNPLVCLYTKRTERRYRCSKRGQSLLKIVTDNACSSLWPSTS